MIEFAAVFKIQSSRKVLTERRRNSKFATFKENIVNMRLAIAKFVFTIVIFVHCPLLSTANNVHFAIETYMNKSLQPLCEDDVLLDFSKAEISDVKQNFISSPIITCLNLKGIKSIETGAFNKLPNLTQLFLSNSILVRSQLFNFGSLDKLQVLIMNSVTDIRYCSDQEYDYQRYGYQNYGYESYQYQGIIKIVGEYPNLEILSLRKNCLHDLQFDPEETQSSVYNFKTHDINRPIALTAQKVPFPKLKILDLSGNGMKETNFVNLLSNSLVFLDLHDNSLNELNLNEKGNKLYALNVNNNNFSYISYSHSWHSLSVTDLKDLRYLSVSENKIDHIESSAFQDNNYLIYLNLSVNIINDLHPMTFANLQYLQTLDLSNNILKDVPKLSNETKISTLYINHNHITKVLSQTFAQMPKLTQLLMGGNQINEIDVNAFAHLSVLEELDLSMNMLSFLPEGWAEPLESLKYLHLSNNKFTSLESLSLTNTLPVIKIYFVMNPLENLNVRYFENLPQNLTINLLNSTDTTPNTAINLIN